MTGPQAGSRNAAVDGLKGLAIVSVLLLHSLSMDTLRDWWAIFHIWQAVPVLLILMGYTGVLTRVEPVSQYLTRRSRRLLVPLGAIWLLSLAIAAAKHALVWDARYLIGLLPATGPGNYFVTLALTFALALPLLRRLLAASPWALVVFAFVVSLAAELLFVRFPYDSYLHSASLLRVLFCVALGMALAHDRRSSRWILLLLIGSVPYLVRVAAGLYVPFMAEPWQSQSLLAAGYPAAIVVVGLRLRFPVAIQRLGKASYHIFLVQILWFEHVSPLLPGLGLSPMLQVLVNLIACVGLGMTFARLEAAVMPSERRQLAPAPA